MVRQFAAESTEVYFLRIETPSGRWPREEQFELMCGFAATLAEDLFTEARLAGAVINAGNPIAIRRVQDLELFLDQLAVLEREAADRGPEAAEKVDAAAKGANRRAGYPGWQGSLARRHLCARRHPGSGRLHRWTKDGHSLALTNCGSSGGCSAAC